MDTAATIVSTGARAQHIQATEHIKPMRGGSQAHLMRCSDGKHDNQYYVVKFKNNPQGRRILVNDWIGTNLAASMGLPTATTAIVKVDSELIDSTPSLRFELTRKSSPCESGYQFGSRYVWNPNKRGLVDFLPNEILPTVENISDFAGMIVFDKLTCNTDGRQTVFVPRAGSYRAVMIDQGFCFNACEWNFPDSPLRGKYARAIVYDHVSGIEAFDPWLSWVESDKICRFIDSVIESVPPEWYEDDCEALLRLLDRLALRRKIVRSLIEDLASCALTPFRSWRKTCSIQVATRVGVRRRFKAAPITPDTSPASFDCASLDSYANWSKTYLDSSHSSPQYSSDAPHSPNRHLPQEELTQTEQASDTAIPHSSGQILEPSQ